MVVKKDASARFKNLQRIADAIGIPVETFYSDAPGEAGELLNLIRLWSAVEDKQARQRILMLARHEFERSRSVGMS